jgi:precorrin-6A/cobalt-precorrin-6A reductase
MSGESRVLILGGTAEARALAERIGDRAIYSLAGRTSSPRLPKCEVRTGPFGGSQGLADFIGTNHVGALIDATHPFADAIPFHAAEACALAGISRLKMVRSPWRAEAGDRWLPVDGPRAAALAVQGIERVFLAIGIQDLGAFAFVTDTLFLVRSVEKLGDKVLPLCAYEHIAARGPFSLAEERALLSGYLIEAIVCKNSGGSSSYAKLEAARELGINVVMIERPPHPSGEVVETVEDALNWLMR